MISRLIEIASSIEATSLVAALQDIKVRMEKPNAEVILPLVGEFSSGKTTLINALTDSKALETSTLPTTATIFEIHFGMPSCRATVYCSDGTLRDVEDIASLKNDELAEAKMVCVDDTSNKVPESITIVDTPGLSSADIRHKQALVDFLPLADAVLLVVDINQQVTRSLTDFVETMNLAKRPVFLVITKCDSKSPSEIEASRKYISENCKLPLEQTACVSATGGDVTELNRIFDVIQKDKNKILEAVNGQRIKNIAKELDERIVDILSKTTDNKSLQEAIIEAKEELNIINRNISNLMDNMKGDIDEAVMLTARQFEDALFPKLDAIVSVKGANFDSEMVAAVNGTASLFMSNFQAKIAEILTVNCQKRIGTEGAINLQSLRQLDLSQLEVGPIGANLGLNSMGHENDATIGKAVLVLGAIACMPAAAGAIGGAGTAAAVEGAGAVGAGTAIATLDTVTDVASVAYTAHAVNKISKLQKMQQFAGRLQQGMETAQTLDNQYGQNFGQNNGIIASCVGFFTERFVAKPQRQRAVRNYISFELIPEVKQRLNSLSQALLLNIQQVISSEAQVVIEEKTNLLNSLKAQLEDEKTVFENRKKELKLFRNELQNI